MPRQPSRTFRGTLPGEQPPPESAGEPSHLHAPIASDAPRARVNASHVELILQQLESLPTLGPIAVRVLQRTSDDDVPMREIVELVSADPALSAKVIKICRCSEHGRGFDVTTVERAVKVLGFDGLRSAVLSVKVFEILDGMDPLGGADERAAAPIIFDRVAFWQHSLAVATVCEALAGTRGPCAQIAKPDAFIGGLLHDLGALALHVLLPRTFDRVCHFADANSLTLNQACRKIIGVDAHTVGRRLAEHWRLPHVLGDIMWLHGQSMQTVPHLPHRAQIGLVTLADIVARANGLTPLGHGPRGEDAQELMAYLHVDRQQLNHVCATLPETVAARCASLGIDRPLTSDALLSTVGRANVALGRLNAGLRQRALLAERQTRTLRAITHFHDTAAPGGSVINLMGKVVESAVSIFGGGFFAVLYQPRLNEPWQFIQFALDGRPLRTELITPPPGSTAVSDLADDTQVSMQALAMLPWLSDYLGDSRDLRDVHLLPLRCGWGVNAVLLHDCEVDGREAREQLEALGRTWAAAIAAGAQHEGAKRLGEQLAESNRALIDTQDELARSQALAALGEIAAGAAHEMNNPLTVISGRSQLLASILTDPDGKAMAAQIAEQSHRLSDMITALRTYAEPTTPVLQTVNLAQLLDAAMRETTARYQSPPALSVEIAPELRDVHLDPQQIGRAISELLQNAVESEGCRHVALRAHIESVNDRLIITVTDDGSGLSQHALAHAFDPFFSAKPAGRQPGLGLSQARRLVEAHGGQITLENTAPPAPRGAVARIRLSQWRGTPQQRIAA